MTARLLRWFFFVVGITLVNANALASAGRILSFEGDVRVNGIQVNESTVLQSTDTIATGADGEVKIVLSDNSVLDLDNDTEIKISDYSFDVGSPEDNASQVDVVEGSLRYVSGLIAKEDPEDVGFTAGNSTIGVRGSYTGIETSGDIVNPLVSGTYTVTYTATDTAGNEGSTQRWVTVDYPLTLDDLLSNPRVPMAT